jgi:hypothetical protein
MFGHRNSIPEKNTEKILKKCLTGQCIYLQYIESHFMKLRRITEYVSFLKTGGAACRAQLAATVRVQPGFSSIDWICRPKGGESIVCLASEAFCEAAADKWFCRL